MGGSMGGWEGGLRFDRDDSPRLMGTNETTHNHAGTLTVTAVIFGVGLFLFLLPPVPGVPIYLTGGIILVAAVRGVAWRDVM